MCTGMQCLQDKLASHFGATNHPLEPRVLSPHTAVSVTPRLEMSLIDLSFSLSFCCWCSTTPSARHLTVPPAIHIPALSPSLPRVPLSLQSALPSTSVFLPTTFPSLTHLTSCVQASIPGQTKALILLVWETCIYYTFLWKCITYGLSSVDLQVDTKLHENRRTWLCLPSAPQI